MSTSSPRDIAIYIALIASGIAGVTFLIIFWNSPKTQALAAVAGVLFIFIAVFIVAQYLLNIFIFEKINPIYKTIHNLNLSNEDIKKQLEDRDIVEDVNREVLIWANTKSKEIDKLMEMEKYRKEFIGNVSHELKTPIFNIQGYVLTLLDGGLEDSNVNRIYLERTEKSINRLIAIVEDLDMISKLESKVLRLDLDRVNIVQLVEEVYEAQDMRAKKRKIKLLFDRSYDKPIWVLADRKRIYQALVNLVVNSINYGKDGGRTVISFSDMFENILVEVKDDGIGIPQSDIPRIFERFYRVDKSRSRDQGGTGLGLAIVKHIIEAHNQTINVRSGINEGTSFVFTLRKGSEK
jgi:two-component system phosphate regulon sensor histidine kinase PhoR